MLACRPVLPPHLQQRQISCRRADREKATVPCAQITPCWSWPERDFVVVTLGIGPRVLCH